MELIYLDLRKSHKPPFYKKGDPEILRVVRSRLTENAYDIVEDGLPDEFVKRMRSAVSCYSKMSGLTNEEMAELLLRPVCVTSHQIKTNGATLVIK